MSGCTKLTQLELLSLYCPGGRSRFPVFVCPLSLSLSLVFPNLSVPPVWQQPQRSAEPCWLFCVAPRFYAAFIGLCALPARFSHFASTPALLSKFISVDLQDDRRKEGSARKAGRCLRPARLRAARCLVRLFGFGGWRGMRGSHPGLDLETGTTVFFHCHALENDRSPRLVVGCLNLLVVVMS